MKQIKARVLALLAKSSSKKHPLTTDDIRRVFPDITLKQMRPILSKAKAKKVLFFVPPAVTYASSKMGDKGGYYMNPKKKSMFPELPPPGPSRTKLPKSPEQRQFICSICGEQAFKVQAQQTICITICSSCEKLKRQIIYVRDRLAQGGQAALLMEIAIRETVLLTQDIGFNLSEILWIHAARTCIQEKGVDITTVPTIRERAWTK